MENLWPLPGQPFDLHLEGVIAADGTLTLSSLPVAAGEVWAVNYLFVDNLDGNATLTKLYAGRIGVERLIDEWPTLTKDTGRMHSDAFYLTDGQYLKITLAGGTSTHRVTVHAQGTLRGTGGPKVPVDITG